MEAATREIVNVWMTNGVPAAMLWGGRRWRVIDTPTRLHEEPDYVPPMVTQPPVWPQGWRFTASTAPGNSRVFDVRLIAEAWTIVVVYE